MVAWAHNGRDAQETRRFRPAIDKRNLFALGFIAAQSRHSTGTAVDLTLIRLPPQPADRFDPATRYGACTGPASQRAPDNSIDMGTGFDAAVPVDGLIDGAQRTGVPLDVLDLSGEDAPAAYRHALVLSRPDRHVAWRGDCLPDDVEALLSRISGHAVTVEA